MGHSFVSGYMHYVFSTKERRNLIALDLRERLWAYMGGIARENSMKALSVGGTDNHAHLLVSLPSTITIAKAIQHIKAGSSKWVSETHPLCRDFEWQEGYGAFSVNQSLLQTTVEYIENQQSHHQRTTFEEEFIAFLEKHGIAYDPRYVFD